MTTHDVVITAMDIRDMARAIHKQMVTDNKGIEQDVPSLELVTKALQAGLEEIVEELTKHPTEESAKIEREFHEWLAYYERKEKRKQEAEHV